MIAGHAIVNSEQPRCAKRDVHERVRLRGAGRLQFVRNSG